MTQEEKDLYLANRRLKYKENPDAQKSQSKEWKRNHPATRERQDLKRRYGITPEQREGLLDSQDFKCAACGRRDPDHKKGNWWNIDHDHLTGHIRGILCRGCNNALGCVKDSLDNILALAAYLQRKPDFSFEVL